jgi:hypothetical protein
MPNTAAIFRFLIVYTVEAYPVGSPCPYSGTEVISTTSTEPFSSIPIQQPKTYEERVLQATNCKWQLSITTPMVIDEVDNPVWCTYGPASNIAYLIDTNGTIVIKQPYYVPEDMETAIVKYLQDNSK